VPLVSWVHRQLASIVTSPLTVVQEPWLEHFCQVIFGWVSVVWVATCCAEAAATKTDSAAILVYIVKRRNEKTRAKFDEVCE
jgi:hypothetical protein